MDRTADFDQRLIAVAPHAKKTAALGAKRSAFDAGAGVLWRRLEASTGALTVAQLRELQAEFTRLDSSLRDEERSDHRLSILGILRDGIQEAATKAHQKAMNVQRQQQEVAALFNPVVEYKKAPEPGPGANPTLNLAPEVEERFASENQRLAMKFESNLDHLVATRAKVEEIGSIMNIFGQKVHDQQEMVEAIHQTADESIGYVEQAEQHLLKAKERSESYKFYVVVWFYVASVILLLLDWLF